MLYLIATPIGNLGDITFRAVETLRSCDFVLCEDTRHSRTLLTHYNIQKPLKSYHKFNEIESQAQILEEFKAGKKVALISDAGTPGISDPGLKLVQACIHENIPVISIPGPCAAISALVSSGHETALFQFIGFLPRKSNELRQTLQNALAYAGTSICYESPQRLLKTLELIGTLAPERPLTVAKELTKKFEEVVRGKSVEQLKFWNSHPLKGEIVLIISGQTASLSQDWSELTPQEHVEYLEKSYGLTRREAIKMAAGQRDLPKRTIYNIIHTS